MNHKCVYFKSDPNIQILNQTATNENLLKYIRQTKTWHTFIEMFKLANKFSQVLFSHIYILIIWYMYATERCLN